MTPTERRAAREYDALAELYDRYFSDKLDALMRGEPIRGELVEPLEQLPPRAAVLDCACGPGRLTLALAKRGYRACGTDISAAEIALARRHAREFGLKATFRVAAWSELPRKIARRFDLVFCAGNAICHCRDEREMLAALRGMRAVLKPGATLYLDTRCWETYRRERRRFDTFAPKLVERERLLWLNVRHYPRRFTDEHLTEVVIISERDGETTVRAFPVTFYPFRVGDLARRLRACGFTDIQSTYATGVDWYAVTARA